MYTPYMEAVTAARFTFEYQYIPECREPRLRSESVNKTSCKKHG